ncbi:hypothetical protein J7L68_02900 [bacterium]|nr:hypothetical protein [bacterium]
MRTKIFYAILFAAISILLFYGCSKDETPPEPPSITAPVITPIPYDDSIKVIWANSPELGESGFKGYYLYASRNIDLASLSSSELDSYLVFDSTITDTEYFMTDYLGDSLDDGSIYYFAIKAVRTVDSGDTLSGLRVVETSPVVLGSARIYYYESDTICAFNFSDGVALSSSETEPEPDMYLDTSNTSESGLILKSPDLAGGVWTGASQFKMLGVGGIDDFPDADATEWGNSIDVSSVRVCAIKTSQNHYAKVKVLSFGTDGFGRYYIDFDYKYQTKTNYSHF